MAVGLFAFTGSSVLADAAKPMRHLEYQFSVGVSSESTTHSSGIGGAGGSADSGNGPSGPANSASGINTLRSGNSDDGTIVADLMTVSGDGGQVYMISEHARQLRNAEPTQCIVYSSTYVICDTSKKVYDEEIALLRTLGKNFTHAVPLDSKNHWAYHENSPTSTETDDYTIVNSAGGILTLSLEGVVKVGGVNAYNAATSGTITYNRGLAVPVAISEQTITHADQGSGSSNRGQTTLSLKLLNDSMAAAGSHPQ